MIRLGIGKEVERGQGYGLRVGVGGHTNSTVTVRTIINVKQDSGVNRRCKIHSNWLLVSFLLLVIYGTYKLYFYNK